MEQEYFHKIMVVEKPNFALYFLLALHSVLQHNHNQMHFLSTMKFEPTIDLGSILALVGMIASLYAFHIRNVKKIAHIEQRVTLMWNTFKKRFNISDAEENDEDFLFR